jgi:hypothetical protein
MNRLILTAVALTSFSVWIFAADSPARSSFSIHDFGASGGGQTKDTVAFQKALDACAAAGGGTVVVPKGVYVIGSVVIGAKTTLRLASGANILGSPDIADYPLVRARFEGEFVQAHRALISAENADGISITGAGSIFGPPLTVSRLREPRGPVLIELTGCTNVVLEGFSTQYQQLWSIHLLYCQNVTARSLTIRTINTNGDGIDVDSSRDVMIERCSIDTGDDAISLKSGRGMEARLNGSSTGTCRSRAAWTALSRWAPPGRIAHGGIGGACQDHRAFRAICRRAKSRCSPARAAIRRARRFISRRRGESRRGRLAAGRALLQQAHAGGFVPAFPGHSRAPPNCPSCFTASRPLRRGDRVDTVKRLARDSKNIVGIKEAGGSCDRVSQLRAALGREFHHLSGDDSLTLPFMSVGAHGVVSVASNVIPKEVSQMVKGFATGKPTAAMRCTKNIIRCSRICSSRPIPRR